MTTKKDTQTKGLPATMPLLPGHMYEDHLGQTHHKTQQFALVNKTFCEKTNFIKQEIDENLIDSLRLKTPLNLSYGNRKKPENDYIPRIQPPWLKYDRQVLRFYAYFQESVVESSKENYRLRKVRIYFYLSDNTIFVNEPRVQNSGLTQGMYIKRQKIPQTFGKTEEHFSWDDFNLASNVRFFERVFRIYDADPFTKEFYTYMGQPLAEPQPEPTDNFQYLMSRKDLKINPPDTKEYKEYIEVSLGVGHPNGGLEKYLNNDRKVLSFQIFWHDETLEGGTNFYTLNYFLADDTIEVNEVKRHNSGQDPFPLMLGRGRVPKQPIMTHYPGMTMKKEQFYAPSDLMIGNYVRIYSKDCMIYDCDEFTKSWYLQNMRIEMKPITIEKEKPRRFVHPVPPYNGYGTPEDSLGSVYSLQPKPPPKDILKMYTQDQYILRFQARLVSPTKDDNSRQFIISFFCGDDTIMVYEDSNQNSGVWRGQFLERTQLVNPETKQYFKDGDLQVGQIISVSIWTFQLLRPDEFTLNYMKDHFEKYPQADISQVIQKLKEQASQYKNLDEFLVDFVKRADKGGKGYIEFVELAEGIKELGFNLNYQQEYTLFKHFDTQGIWQLSMRDLFVGLGGQR